jgi:hypothetical protein
MKATLVVMTWPAAMVPQASTQPLPNLAACRQVMTALAEDLAQVARKVARSNLTRSHLLVLKAGADEVILRPEATGREIARLRCKAALTPRAP